MAGGGGIGGHGGEVKGHCLCQGSGAGGWEGAGQLQFCLITHLLPFTILLVNSHKSFILELFPDEKTVLPVF